ncbi:unnamed protein product, partial [Allacma fusca]
RYAQRQRTPPYVKEILAAA